MPTKPFFAAAMLSLSLYSAACGGARKPSSSGVSSAVATATTAKRGDSTRAASSPPPQDDNHIATYGKAATEPDRREITSLVTRYYRAAAADDGTRACSLLVSSVAKSVPEDYGKAPGPPAARGKTCPVVMSKIFNNIPGESRADFATTRVTGIRVNPSGNRGFVQLSSPEMLAGEIVVLRDGHSWKVGALIGRSCTDCAAG